MISGQVILAEYQKLLNARTKLVSFTQVSNALGTVTPAQEMIAMAHRRRRQSFAGRRTIGLAFAGRCANAWIATGWCFPDTKSSDLPASACCTARPNCWKRPALARRRQYDRDVTFEITTYQPAPAKFEAGTGNIADAVVWGG